MRRSLFLAVIASLAAACVTVEAPPDPRGTVKPGQRLIVMVHQSPGPWIIADSDSKAETALKLLPLGTFLQGMQEDRINELSKEIQPYLPRPRYDQAVEAELIKALKAAHGGPVQTAAEAGITPAQRREWNAGADQLEWRRKYYFTDAGRQSPRDYTKLLALDDALVLDVNLSFGLEPDEQERTLPTLSAAARLYRADTARMLWSREEHASDTTSSMTLTEFRASPPDLTDRIYLQAAPLAQRLAQRLARETSMIPAPPPITGPAPAGAFYNGAPTGGPAVPPEISTVPVPMTPWIPPASASTAPAASAAPAISTVPVPMAPWIPPPSASSPAATAAPAAAPEVPASTGTAR